MWILMTMALCAAALQAPATTAPADAPEPATSESTPDTKAESLTVTRHSIVVDGRKLDYTATAGKRWEEARGLLQSAMQINGENAIDLAFLAMCEHRLGESTDALATHQRLRDLLARQQYAFNPDDQEALDEVEEMFGAPTQVTSSSN